MPKTVYYVDCKFSLGEIVKHKLTGKNLVISSIDAEFSATYGCAITYLCRNDEDRVISCSEVELMEVIDEAVTK